MATELIYLGHRFQCFTSEHTGAFMHIHKEVELLYFLEGSVKITCNTKEYTLTAGDVILIFPYTIHRVEKLSPVKYLLCTFNVDILPFFSSVFTNFVVDGSPVVNIGRAHPDALDSLSKISQRKELQKESNTTFGYLTVAIENLLANLTLVEKSDHNNADWLVLAMEYINDNFKNPIRLDDLAQHLSVSKYVVSRRFNSAVGCSIEQYTNSIRIDYAKNLLRFSKLPITEVALESGFENISTFYRVFKDLGQGTPKEFRKNKRNI